MNNIKRYNSNNISLVDNKTIFFLSYESKIARIKNGVLTLFEKWNYSQTTLKFLYMFLNDNINNINESQKNYILYALNDKNKKAILQRCINLKYIKCEKEL